ncbi:hypothetical protein ACFDTO_03370 [Microbacteriaceae bacterium 4G12]
MSKLTPHERQDIENANSAPRPDSGWAEVTDAAPTIVVRDGSDAQASGRGPDTVPVSEHEPEPPAATPPGSARATPEAKGIPTAG